jgi:hypothetical protein
LKIHAIAPTTDSDTTENDAALPSWCFYEETMIDSVNPNWLLSDNNISMKRRTIDAQWKESSTLKISVYDRKKSNTLSSSSLLSTSSPPMGEDDADDLILETSTSLTNLVFLGDTELEDLPLLPLNSIFFLSERGLYATEETFANMKKLESQSSSTAAQSTDHTDWEGIGHTPINADDPQATNASTRTLDSRVRNSTDTSRRSRFDSQDDNHRTDDSKQEEETEADRIKMKTLAEVDECRKNIETLTNDVNMSVVENKVKLLELQKLQEIVLSVEQEAEDEEKALTVELNFLKDAQDLTSHISQCELLQQRIIKAETERDSLKEIGTKARFLLEARQLKLLAELQTIYPIEPFWPSDDAVQSQSGGSLQGSHPPTPPLDRHTSKGNLQVSSTLPPLHNPHLQARWAIRGLELPPLDCPVKDEEQLATVLGYVTHVVLLLSKYQQINLRYQLLYYSSRSMVRDPTASGAQNQNLPLYRTNAEPERFKKAVLWLAKDIEQILMIKGHTYDHHKDVLYNLHQVFRSELIPQFS